MVIPLEKGSLLDALRLVPRLRATSLLPVANLLTQSLDARQRPSGRFGYDWLSRSRKSFQKRAGTSMNSCAPSQIGISQRIAGIAHQAAPFGALDGAVSEHFPEFCFAHTR